MTPLIATLAICTAIFLAIAATAPKGRQDRDGFHYGDGE